MTSLWALLENCLEELAKTCHDHAVLVMQNMVECFFIVHAGDRDFRVSICSTKVFKFDLITKYD